MAKRPPSSRSSSSAGSRRILIPIIAIVMVAIVTLAGVRLEVPTRSDPVPDADPTATSDPAADVMWVGTDVLNLRAAPSLDGDVIGTGTEGETVEITGAAVNGFSPVRIAGTDGWMSTSFLQAERAPLSMPRVSTGGEPVSAAEVVVDPGGEVWAQPTAEPEVIDEPPAETETLVGESAPDDDGLDLEETADSTAAPGERWIEVDRSAATVTLHHGNDVVATFVGKIGRDPSANGYYSTAIGTFHVYSMDDGLAETPFADGVYLTNWVGFDPERENGFHSPTLDSRGSELPTQNPTTLGCVRLDADAARMVFEFAHIGMRVHIHD